MKNYSFYIVGFVKIKISGENKNKFLNLAVKNGFKFWGFKSEEDFYTVHLKTYDYKLLANLRREYKLIKSVKLKIVKKAGSTVLINLARKRLGVTVGFLVGVLLYMFMYSHYWVIQAPSGGIYTQETLVEAAKNAGVYEGASKQDLNMRVAAYKMMSELPELSWLSLNTNGCVVEISLKYKEKAAEPISKQGVENIIASKTGIIRAVEAKNGMVEVELGQAVKEGDLLITGIWDSNRGYEEWEQKEEVDIFYEKAMGKVMAETLVDFEVSLSEYETEYIQHESYSRYNIGFFGINIPITLSLAPSGDYNYTQRQENLWLLGVKLPIYVKTETLNKLYKEEVKISEAEALIRLDKLMELEIEKLMGEDGEVLKRFETVYEYEDNVYTAKLQCICLENIAKVQEVVIK